MARITVLTIALATLGQLSLVLANQEPPPPLALPLKAISQVTAPEAVVERAKVNLGHAKPSNLVAAQPNSIPLAKAMSVRNAFPVLSRTKRVQRRRRSPNFLSNKRKRTDSDLNENEARELLALLTLLAAKNSNDQSNNQVNAEPEAIQPEETYETDRDLPNLPYGKTIIFDGTPRFEDQRDLYYYDKAPKPKSAFSRSRQAETVHGSLDRLRPLGFQSPLEDNSDRDTVPVYSLDDLLAAGYGREVAMKKRRKRALSILNGQKKWKFL